MTVSIKSPEDIEKMRIAGRLAAEVLEMIEPHVKAGVTTEELNRICHDYIVDVQKAIPAPLNYKGFPKSICTSINHVVCHGIPNDKPLKDGDILNIDITVIKDGYFGDTSKMFLIGKVPEWAERLCQVTQECLYKGISVVRPGARLGDIGEIIQKHAEKHGFSVVREYCGHGIGTVFHEEPQVVHYGRAGTGLELKAGMTFTIEPMINQGRFETRLLGDGWTAITKDRKLSAQYEHTILVDRGRLRDPHPAQRRHHRPPRPLVAHHGEAHADAAHRSRAVRPRPVPGRTGPQEQPASPPSRRPSARPARCSTGASAAGCDIRRLIHARAWFVDQILGQAWAALRLGRRRRHRPGGGRRLRPRRAAPHSDIDMLILLDGADHERLREPIEGFLTLLWDIGLEVGQSVRYGRGMRRARRAPT